jgi:hypothetical protein
MKELLSRFSRNLIILTGLLSLAGGVLFFLLPSVITPALPWLILFFLFSTFLIFYRLLKASNGKFNRFTNLFMIVTVVKLLLLLGIITIYLFINRDDAIRFALTMFVLYLLYSVFEVLWLLKINKLNTTA